MRCSGHPHGQDVKGEEEEGAGALVSPWRHTPNDLTSSQDPTLKGSTTSPVLDPGLVHMDLSGTFKIQTIALSSLGWQRSPSHPSPIGESG